MPDVRASRVPGEGSAGAGRLTLTNAWGLDAACASFREQIVRALEGHGGKVTAEVTITVTSKGPKITSVRIGPAWINPLAALERVKSS